MRDPVTMAAAVYSAPYLIDYNILFSRPECPARAAVLFFHGGGWLHGEPMFCAPLWPALLAEGIVCGTAELRTKYRDRTATVHQCMEDAKLAAARFARMFPVVPKFLCGASAGGAMALVAATKHYDGCVLFNPILDLSANGFVNKMTVDADCEDVSPIHLVGKREFPRTLILHGGLDSDIPLSASERYASAVPNAQLVRFPHSGHGFATRAGNLDRVSRLIIDFIGGH